MQEEFVNVVFEFVKRIASLENILSIFLFGSVARGDADKRSDVDILVVFDTIKNPEKLKEKKDVSKIVLEVGKKFDKNIQLVFSNKNFDKLDRQFVENIYKEGIIIFGKNPQIDIKKLKLIPHSLIHYSMKGLNRSEKMKVKNLLYGRKTIKKYKKKIYKSEFRGLLYEVGGKRTGIASVLVPAKEAGVLMNALKKFSIKYWKIDVWLSEV